MKINKQKLITFLRIDGKDLLRLNIFTTILGIILFGTNSAIHFPVITIGMIPLQIDFSLVIIATTSIIAGPLSGFLVGYLGSLSSDIIFSDQVIAYTILNFSYGIFGLIMGIPKLNLPSLNEREERSDRIILKLIFILLLGFIIFSLLYLFSLIVVGQHSVMGSILYNYLPILGKYLISLLLYSPIIILILNYTITPSER